MASAMEIENLKSDMHKMAQAAGEDYAAQMASLSSELHVLRAAQAGLESSMAASVAAERRQGQLRQTAEREAEDTRAELAALGEAAAARARDLEDRSVDAPLCLLIHASSSIFHLLGS